MRIPKLKPCPFCGSDDLCYMFYGGSIIVHCRGCGIEGPFGADDDEAAEKWNRRAEVKGDARMIDNIEHVSFIEGLLFYIALRLGDKESLMMFLKTWGKEYEKHELEDLGGGRDDAGD